jgi:hypothetical protein
MAGCARTGNRENVLLFIGLMMTWLAPFTTLAAFVFNTWLLESGAGGFCGA